MLNRRIILLFALVVLGNRIALAQEPAPTRAVVRTPGRGRPGTILQQALAQPFHLIAPDSVAHLPRDSTIDRTVLIVGGDATVASVVQGDVIVVDGDLFLHPGAEIHGRAIAIGGGVYMSSLARVVLGTESFRDVTFTVSRDDGRLYLDYRVISAVPLETLTFPIVFGFRLPTYTRVDGLGLPWGPRIMLDTGRIVIDALVTYRSDLGEVDPSLGARMSVGRLTSVELRAGRATFTNDAWIQSDLPNLLYTLSAGRDYRNYWRADRIEGVVQRRWERAATLLAIEVGGRTERAWSVAAGGPWSFYGKNDAESGMFRPNPPVEHGRITSALAGARFGWDPAGLSLSTALLTETALDAPGDARFTQATLDFQVGFPAFRSHTFALEGRAVHTFGDTAPPQRFSYLGGGGTLRTFELLEFGGDRLVYIESRYSVPIERIRIPIVGSPVVTLRHMIGMAGIDSLPPLEQNLGLRVRVGPLTFNFSIEPLSRETHTSVGLSLAR